MEKILDMERQTESDAVRSPSRGPRHYFQDNRSEGTGFISFVGVSVYYFFVGFGFPLLRYRLLSTLAQMTV